VSPEGPSSLAGAWLSECIVSVVRKTQLVSPIRDNACHTPFSSASCLGEVNYTYQISTYEVTNSQYVEFLNAIAATDPNALYNPAMSSDGGVMRSGSDGSYSYNVITGRDNMPVNFVPAVDALRFVNWLDSGQPTGMQNDASTEDGYRRFELRFQYRR